MYYIVDEEFKDLENNIIYNKNDFFPKEKPKEPIVEERYSSLSSKNNKLGKVLIHEVALNELTEEQLITYAHINDIDISILIKDEIISREENNKGLEDLRKRAKKLKINFSDEVTMEELRIKIEETEKNKKLVELKKQAKKLKIDFSDEVTIEELETKINEIGNH